MYIFLSHNESAYFVTPPKVNRFGYKIWSTVSTLLGAGPGRFWARCPQ